MKNFSPSRKPTIVKTMEWLHWYRQWEWWTCYEEGSPRDDVRPRAAERRHWSSCVQESISTRKYFRRMFWRSISLRCSISVLEKNRTCSSNTEHLLTRVELCRSVVETTWPTSSLQNIVHGTLLISTRPSSHLGGSGKERMLYQTQQLGFFNAVLIKAWVETDDCLRRAVDAFPKCLRICILQKDEQVGHL